MLSSVVHGPGSIHLLGFQFQECFYFDVTLSMGSSFAAFCCQRMTDVLTFIFKKGGFDDVNYLDDIGGAEVEEQVEIAFQCLGKILLEIRIKESESKACTPATVMIFLGILFNTISMTLTITDKRLHEIRLLLSNWLNKERYILQELQSLVGKLNFTASTVRAG